LEEFDFGLVEVVVNGTSSISGEEDNDDDESSIEEKELQPHDHGERLSVIVIFLKS
jgi:hypothetical protein